MIWVFIPAFNEENAILTLLEKVTTGLQGREYRIVVVDDGSSDKTPVLLHEASRKYPLQVVTHSINRGLGETERDGFEYIAVHSKQDDIIVRVEGDNTHEPGYILDLIAMIDRGYDVVNTSRFRPGGGQLGLNFQRKFISRCANLFMQTVFNIKGVRDYSCGFRAYRAGIIQDAVALYGNNFIQLKGVGFTSTLEILVKLKLLGCKFAEVPFVLRYDLKQGKSKMVGSITMIGYLLLGLFYHWPFGGWKKSYRNMGKMYQKDRKAAVQKFGEQNVRCSFPTKINS
ncbi:MAG: glycosyltransferase [Chloroflexi bacterium]|nr:glycosyltransferase [Chloroflexota bacterium]